MTSDPARSRTVTVGAVQMTATPDRDQNLRWASELVARAVDEDASIVVLPELFASMGPRRALLDAAEPLDGPTTTWAAEQAAGHGIWLVAGSFVERLDGDRRANTSCVLDPSGDLVASYRKIHLFDCDVPGAVFHESAVFEAGDEVVVADAGPVRIGLSVCYDLRFPELYRALVDDGATLIVVPAAFTARTGQAHWEVLLRARAIEDQCFVVAAGQTGSSGPGLDWHGASMIIDPWGDVLARAPDAAEQAVETAITASCDLERVATVRGVLPSVANRRLAP